MKIHLNEPFLRRKAPATRSPKLNEFTLYLTTAVTLQRRMIASMVIGAFIAGGVLFTTVVTLSNSRHAAADLRISQAHEAAATQKYDTMQAWLKTHYIDQHGAWHAVATAHKHRH